MDKQVDIKSIKATRVLRGIIFGVLMIIYIVLAIFHLNYIFVINGRLSLFLIWAIPYFLLMVFFCLYAFWFPKLQYNNLRYEIDGDKVRLREGVIFVKEAMHPIERIQHVEVVEGPINRIYKLASIAIYTAGSICLINGLDRENAFSLCEEVRVMLKDKMQNRKAVKG